MANEKRLIDANVLMDSHWWESLTDDFDKARAKIVVMSAPTVDAVEVVRSKDCRFCKKHPTYNKVKMCTNEQQWVTECYPLVYDNDFCSYGERKDNG